MELSEQDQRDLRELEERLWRAEYRFDRAWIDAILAEDFFEFGRSGRVYSRDECLASSGKSIDAVLPLPDFSARLLGADVVQTTYISMVTHDGTGTLRQPNLDLAEDAPRLEVEIPPGNAERPQVTMAAIES